MENKTMTFAHQGWLYHRRIQVTNSVKQSSDLLSLLVVPLVGKDDSRYCLSAKPFYF